MRRRFWLALPLAALLLGTPGCVEPPPPVQSIQPIDQSKVEAVQVQLKHDPVLAGCVIQVSAQNDTVVLSGTVPTQQAKDHAEQMAHRVEGITKVKNGITVVPEETQPNAADSSNPF